MNARLGDLALRMATVFSTPSAEPQEDEVIPRLTPADSLLQDDLPMLAQAMLLLSLRMLEPVLSALRHLAQGTPEEATLAGLLGSESVHFETDQVQVQIDNGKLQVTGCESLPKAFLPWVASNLVGAGALLVPRPFADPESLRQQIGTALVRLDRLSSLHRKGKTAQAAAMIPDVPAEAVPHVEPGLEQAREGHRVHPGAQESESMSETTPASPSDKQPGSISPENNRSDTRSPKR